MAQPEKSNSMFTYFRPVGRRGVRSILKLVFGNLFYSLFVRIYRPAKKGTGGEKKKYETSVCMIFKDEAPYFEEWIEFHRLVGIDHFYIYDNNSADNYMEVVEPYIREGLVTLVKWPREHAQAAAYEDCFRRFRNETDWIGLIDIDEFLVPVAERSVKTFLERFRNRPAVLVYWRFFGSGGMLTRDRSRMVTEDFTVASEKLYTKGKCFYNTRYEYLWDEERNRVNFHYLWTAAGKLPVPPVDEFDHTVLADWYHAPGKKIPVQLNHYAVKSLEEHREKEKKGDLFAAKNAHTDATFFARDRRCAAADHQAYKFLARVKNNIEIRREKLNLPKRFKE